MTEAANGAKPAEKTADSGKPQPQDQIAVTQHTVSVNGQTLRYTVTTGTIVLKSTTSASIPSASAAAIATWTIEP